MDAIAAPKPKVLFEAEPFIPYMRDEEKAEKRRLGRLGTDRGRAARHHHRLLRAEKRDGTRLFRLCSHGFRGSDFGSGRDSAAAGTASQAAANHRARLSGRVLEIL